MLNCEYEILDIAFLVLTVVVGYIAFDSIRRLMK
jgi:hypothetical protein